MLNHPFMLGGGQRAIGPGMRHTAYCVLRMPPVTRSTYAWTEYADLKNISEQYPLYLCVFACGTIPTRHPLSNLKY